MTPVSPIPAVLGAMLLWHAGLACAQPALATGADAEITEDGLHRVDRSILKAAWVRPDLDLSRYNKVLFMPTAVTFRDVPEPPRTAFGRDNDTEFPPSDAAKKQLRTEFGETFHEELAETNLYELYAGVGRDVLIVRGFLMDVTSGVPPDVAGVDVDSVRWIWEAGMVIELRDSMSNDVLARTFDRQRAIGPFDRHLVPEETRRIVRRWSRLLCTRLEELSSL